MKVVLIRHTRVDVPKGTCYGWSDVPVAETFVQEAAVTKAKLQRYPAFDAVYSSPLSRAHRLATFCGYPNAIIDNRLKEINMGDWEMQLYDDIEKKDPAIHAWFDVSARFLLFRRITRQTIRTCCRVCPRWRAHLRRYLRRFIYRRACFRAPCRLWRHRRNRYLTAETNSLSRPFL